MDLRLLETDFKSLTNYIVPVLLFFVIDAHVWIFLATLCQLPTTSTL